MTIPNLQHKSRASLQIRPFDRLLRRLMPSACVALIATAFGAAPANAGGVVGTGTPASCTRAAFNTALVGGGTVTFNCGPNPHTITITLAKSVSVDTTINGGGKITLKASGTNHFKVPSGKTLVLENIRLTGGNASTAGAIENLGTTRINGVTFEDNTSTDKGGAIANHGTLIVQGSTFTSNQAVNGGGAIWSDGSSVNVAASGFEQNLVTSINGTGGALGNGTGTLAVANCTFTDNSSAGLGGALYNNGTNANVVLSALSGNEAANLGGAIYNSGALTVDRSTLSGNQAGAGGGIGFQGILLTVIASTLNGNAATSLGGGIYATGNSFYTNSTLSGNQAGSFGGGLYNNRGEVTMLFTTVANNFAVAGAGVYNNSSTSAVLSLQNTVLSNNVSGNCDGGGIQSLGNNLSSDTHCSFVLPSDKSGVDAKLGPLANNRGPTMTHLPQLDSPAINAAVMAGGVTTDQRGVTRPQGPQPDIGSVEAQ